MQILQLRKGYKVTDLKIPGKSCGILLQAAIDAGFDAPPEPALLPAPSATPPRQFYNFRDTSHFACHYIRQQLRLGPLHPRCKAQNWCTHCGYGWESGKANSNRPAR